jgi:RES domain
MSASSCGPSGSPPLPPGWLRTSRLPILELPALTSLVRIHRLKHQPVFFSPGDGKPPVGRFDSPSGAFGVLYLAQSLEGSLAETVLRNPQRKLVDLPEITGRAISVLGPSRALRLAEMRGAGLQALGTDNAISTGPYAPCGAWADALHGHPDKPDGIAYVSRHDPDQLCIALFSRPDIQLDVLSGPTPLADLLDYVAGTLRRYGKGLA